jgi:GNAT superfamily N-acetyltransferase
MTTIRPANVQDADQLAQLRWDFRIEDGTPPTTTLDEFLDEMRSFVGDLLAEGTPWRAWVAEDGARLVGCAWLQVVERVPHPSLRRGERPIAYVTNMYVVPELRNGGIGRELLDAAVAYARERRASAAILWPSPGSAAFYQRAGFTTEDAPLLLPLEGD